MNKQIFNPFLPSDVYIPDGEPHVFNDRVYLFGSHDEENGEGYCLLDYEIWSAPVDDLTDWTSKGINYSAKQDPLYSETMKYLFAPDCVQGNDGRYYLYYCIAGWRGKGGYSNPVSVAVSDEPDGHYDYLGIVRNSDGTPLTRHICFDPAVINDNGTIRLYFGCNYPWFDKMPLQSMKERALMIMSGRSREEIRSVQEGIMGAWHAELCDDMLTVSSEPKRIDHTISGKDYPEHSFFEGSSIRKIGSTYYFIYSSILNHELCYAVSEYPDRGFRYGGTIVSNGDIGYNGRSAKNRLNFTGTNHGSVECVNGQWYVFYHRLTHSSDYSRQACAERIDVLEDGSIPQVEITSCGLNKEPLSGTGTYPAVICCNLTDGRMGHGSNRKGRTDKPCVTSGNNERYIGNIRNHTLIGYKYFRFSGNTSISVKYRGKVKGTMEIRIVETGSPVGMVSLEPAENWTSVYTDLGNLSGTLPLYFYFRGNGKAELYDFTLTESTMSASLPKKAADQSFGTPDIRNVAHDYLRRNRYSLKEYVINDGRKHPFALICPGGGYEMVCSFLEGEPYAKKLNAMGYSAFVLYYRCRKEAHYPAVQDDLARALQYILSHADELNLEKEGYSVWGSSAGGHLAASFGTKAVGYEHYSLPKPGTIILAYPVITMGSYTHQGSRDQLLGTAPSESEIKTYSIERNITPDYPPVYVWCGSADRLVDPENSRQLANALKQSGVPYQFEEYPGVDHGVGLGEKLVCKDWFEHAVSFWEAQRVKEK